MLYLEIIRVRCSPQRSEVLRQRLLRLLDELESHAGVLEPALYAHSRIEGDFAFHLAWSRHDGNRRSDIAHLVADQLGDLGLVDYAAWRQVSGGPHGVRGSSSFRTTGAKRKE